MTRNTLGIILFLAFTAGLFAVFAIFGEKPPKPVDPAPPPEQSRSKRVEPATAEYRNTAPDVHYMGDQACENCHFNETESFRRHPMSKSVGEMAGLDLPPLPEILKFGRLQYSIEKRDGKTFHNMEELDDSGKVVKRESRPVPLYMGSGQRGLTFLLDNQGKLLQSPIAWYSNPGRYDIAPGFTAVNNDYFQRDSLKNCFFCHTNHVEKAVADEPGRMHAKVIGCERCHGPGELHVNQQEKQGGIDPTIVNPAKLSPARRDMVCNQCHLQLDSRTDIEGRQIADYRPGLDLENFVRRSANSGADPLNRLKSSSHINQMEQSVCFEKSDGQMGCLSCHNPHDWPEKAKKVEYYRNRCLSCHTRPDPCALPSVSRLAQSPENNCIGCHMPRQSAVDKAHTALTDHGIRRKPQQ